MKKNGFTLIELLGILVILAVIGLITVPIIFDSIKSSQKKLYVEQVDRIINAAKAWSADLNNDIPEPTSSSTPKIITVKSLKKAGLLKNEKIKNPLSSKDEMVENVAIYYDSTYSQYSFVYCDNNYGKNYYTDAIKFNEMKEICSRAR